MRAGISFHRGPPASDVIFQHPIMEDPPSLLVDYHSPWQIPYSPLISEEPLKGSHIRAVLTGRWGDAAPATWNARLTAIQSFVRYCRRNQ